MITEERMIVREGARYWWVFLLTGIAWLVIAWLVLRLNVTSLTTVGVLLGVIFFMSIIASNARLASSPPASTRRGWGA